MIRQGLTVRVLCGLVLCGLMTGCSDSASPTGPTGGPAGPSAPQVVDRTFTLALNESASVHDGALELTFRRVVKDERCPADANCLMGAITEAVIEFDFTLRDGGFARQSKITLTTQTARAARIGVYTVSLEQLMPYPFGSLPPIKPEEWRTSVRITSALN
jgi:hypothetical protein